MIAARPASPVIFRQVSFSLEAFDRLKDWQRFLEAREGRHFTNGMVLDRLILAQSLPTPKGR